MDSSRVVGVIASLIIVIVLAACGCGSQQPASLNWKYPVRFGDSRARVHELLGAPNTGLLSAAEKFWASGVDVEFGPEGRVTGFTFDGVAAAPYGGPEGSYPTEREFFAGLGAQADEATFRRVLGIPVDDQQREALYRRSAWRRDGFLIQAAFLAVETSAEGRTLAKGTLFSVTISQAEHWRS